MFPITVQQALCKFIQLFLHALGGGGGNKGLQETEKKEVLQLQ
jgi:hypothetical protein